jgi:hypothetical protein
VPTIRRFSACKISIYADDHVPPHFHIEGRGFRAIIEIETMIVRVGEIRRAADAMIWGSREHRAAAHRMGAAQSEDQA